MSCDLCLSDSQEEELPYNLHGADEGEVYSRSVDPVYVSNTTKHTGASDRGPTRRVWAYLPISTQPVIYFLNTQLFLAALASELNTLAEWFPSPALRRWAMCSELYGWGSFRCLTLIAGISPGWVSAEKVGIWFGNCYLFRFTIPRHNRFDRMVSYRNRTHRRTCHYYGAVGMQHLIFVNGALLSH